METCFTDPRRLQLSIRITVSPAVRDGAGSLVPGKAHLGDPLGPEVGCRWCSTHAMRLEKCCTWLDVHSDELVTLPAPEIAGRADSCVSVGFSYRLRRRIGMAITVRRLFAISCAIPHLLKLGLDPSASRGPRGTVPKTLPSLFNEGVACFRRNAGSKRATRLDLLFV